MRPKEKMEKQKMFPKHKKSTYELIWASVSKNSKEKKNGNLHSRIPKIMNTKGNGGWNQNQDTTIIILFIMITKLN